MSKKLFKSKLVAGLSLGISSALLLLTFQNCNNKMTADLSSSLGSNSFASLNISSQSSDADLAKVGVSRKYYPDSKLPQYLYDGMIFSADQFDELAGQTKPSTTKSAQSTKTEVISGSATLWPEGKLYFKADTRARQLWTTEGVNITARVQLLVDACNKWAQVANVTCINNEISNTNVASMVWVRYKNYISTAEDDTKGKEMDYCAEAAANANLPVASCATLGRNNYDPATGGKWGWISIKDFHWDNQNILIHEVGHLLGLGHEYQRPDRDTYIVKIDPNDTMGFSQNSSVALPFDYGSIMLQQTTYYDSAEYNNTPRFATSFHLPFDKTEDYARELRRRPPQSVTNIYTGQQLQGFAEYRAQFAPSHTDALKAQANYPFTNQIQKRSCTVGGKTFQHGTTMGFYKTQVPLAAGQICDYEFRICNDGTASGSEQAQYTSCEMRCNLKDGTRFVLGTTIKAYSVASVPAGSTCPAQVDVTCKLAQVQGAPMNYYKNCSPETGGAPPLAWVPNLTLPTSKVSKYVGDATQFHSLKVSGGTPPYTYTITNPYPTSNSTEFVSLVGTSNSEVLSVTTQTGEAVLRFKYSSVLASRDFSVQVKDSKNAILSGNNSFTFEVLAAPAQLTWVVAPPTSIVGTVGGETTLHTIKIIGGKSGAKYNFSLSSNSVSNNISLTNSSTDSDRTSIENDVDGIVYIRTRYLAAKSAVITLTADDAGDSTTTALTQNITLTVNAAGTTQPLEYDNTTPIGAMIIGTVGDNSSTLSFKVKNGKAPYTFKMLTTDAIALQYMSIDGSTNNMLTNSTGSATIRVNYPAVLSDKTFYFEVTDSSVPPATLSYSRPLRVNAATTGGPTPMAWTPGSEPIPSFNTKIGDAKISKAVSFTGGEPPFAIRVTIGHSGGPFLTVGKNENEYLQGFDQFTSRNFWVHMQSVSQITDFQTAVEVKDKNGQTLTKNVSITVNPSTITPEVLQWESGSLPDVTGLVGAASQFKDLKVKGGRPPYRYRISTFYAQNGKAFVDFGGSDAGANMTSLDNTATATVRIRFLEWLAPRNFTVQVFDGDDTMISKSFKLTVNEVPVQTTWVTEPVVSSSYSDTDGVKHIRFEVSGAGIGANFKLEPKIQIGTTSKYYASIVSAPEAIEDWHEFGSTQRYAYIRIRATDPLAPTTFKLTVTTVNTPSPLIKEFTTQITSTKLQWAREPIAVEATEGDGYVDQPVTVAQGGSLITYSVGSTASNSLGNHIFGFVGSSTDTGSGATNLVIASKSAYLRVRADENAGGLSEVQLPIEVTDNNGTKLTKSIKVTILPRFACSVTNSAKASFSVSGTIRISKPHQGQYGHIFMAILKGGKWYTREAANDWREVGADFNSIGSAILGSVPYTGALAAENLSSLAGGELYLGYGMGGTETNPAPAFTEMSNSGRIFKCGTIGN